MSEAAQGSATSVSLLVRLRDLRDQEAWRQFGDVYGPLIYGFCRKSGLQEADAGDVAQEVLLQVCRSIQTFEYDRAKGRFRDWLGAVVRSKVGRLRRSRAHTDAVAADLDRLEGAGGESDWTEYFKSSILRLALERIRPGFEEATWRAFELAWLENRSAAEAATTLNVPVSAVYVAKSRILKRLQEEVLALAEDLIWQG
jgi:RNA polymerase sigma-70 factor (ECF subfamily)